MNEKKHFHIIFIVGTHIINDEAPGADLVIWGAPNESLLRVPKRFVPALHVED